MPLLPDDCITTQQQQELRYRRNRPLEMKPSNLVRVSSIGSLGSSGNLVRISSLDQLGGSPLVRQSSFERILANLLDSSSTEDLNDAAAKIQTFWKKRKKMHRLLGGLLEEEFKSNCLKCSEAISNVSKLDVESAQILLSADHFKNSSTAILSALPRDPSLKSRNSQTRSHNFLATAIIIYAHAPRILCISSSGPDTPDTGPEARLCKAAASLLVQSFSALIKALLFGSGADDGRGGKDLSPSVSTSGPSVSTFRRVLLMHRFCVRFFMTAMDAWKAIDASRLAKSLQEPYKVCFAVSLTTAQALDSPDPAEASMASAAAAQLLKLKQTIERLLGKSKGASMCEELEAAVRGELAQVGSLADIEVAGEEVLVVDAAPAEPQPDSPSKRAAKEYTTDGLAGSVGAGDGSTGEYIPVGLPLAHASAAPPTPPDSLSRFTEHVGESLGPEDQRYLDRLSQIAGMENERIAHEVCLDASYHLPFVRADLDIDETWGLGGAHSALNILHILDDRLVKEMTNSGSSLGKALGRGIVDESGEGDEPSVAGSGDGDGYSDIVGDELALQQAKDLQMQLSENPTAAAALVKSRVVHMMSDSLYWSLKDTNIDASVLPPSSGITSTDLSKHRVCISTGMLVPIEFQGQYMSARVIGIRHPVVSGDVASMPPAEIVMPTLVVRFLADHAIEDGVSLSRVKCANTDMQAELLCNNLTAVLSTVADLTPTRADIRSTLESSLDVELLTQMVNRRALAPSDILPIIHVILNALKNLLEPSRAARLDSWIMWINGLCQAPGVTFQDMVPLIPLILETCMSLVEEVKREMSNYFIESLVPLFRSLRPSGLGDQRITMGALFLRDKAQKRFSQKLAQLRAAFQQNGTDESTLTCDVLLAHLIPKTAGLMLPGTHRRHALLADSNLNALMLPVTGAHIEECLIGVDLTTAKSHAAILFCRLVQVPCRLDGREAGAILPEIHAWDGSRLAAIRDDIDIIALQATLMITLKQTLPRILVRTAASTQASDLNVFADSDFDELTSRMDALLRSPDIDLKSVVIEAVRFVRVCVTRSQALHSQAKVVLLPTFENALTQALTNSVTPSAPILKLFYQRIFKCVLRACAGVPVSPILSRYSLNGDYHRKLLLDCMDDCGRLFAHHCDVYGFIYEMMYSDE